MPRSGWCGVQTAAAAVAVVTRPAGRQGAPRPTSQLGPLQPPSLQGRVYLQ